MEASRRRLKTMILASFVLTPFVLAAPLPAVAQFDLPRPKSSGSPFGTGSGGKKNLVSVKAQFTAPTNGQPSRLFVVATIKPGWYIYSITQPPGGPKTTEIRISPPQGVRVMGSFQASVAPEMKKEPEAFGDLPIETHRGTVTWYAPIELAAGVDPFGVKIEGAVMAEACANACYRTRTPFTAALGPGLALPRASATDRWPSGADNTAGQATSGTLRAALPPLDLRLLLVQLASAFVGGLILNLMPCVLPVISLKILSFMDQAGQHRGRVFALNVWYSLGLLSVFMVLAALAATAGLAWGQQFTLPWFKVAMTAMVFVMALSFLGVWEIPIPGFVGAGRANELQTQEGPGGAFFKGVFTTILATPCSGPFLGPVFGYLLKQPPYMAYWIFGAVGLGMASPYLVVGAYPKLIGRLPKPGAWMETVQQFMAFLLLATVVYLFNTLTPRYFVPTLALLVGLWFACWWIGRTQLRAAGRRQATAWIGGAAVAALVGYAAFTVLLEESKIPWQPFSPAALERARAQGKTVMVDFTANWCPNCKTNSRFAIETNAVRELIEANDVVPLLADWTDESPVIERALKDLGCNSIPQLAIWPPGPPETKPIVLSDLLRESQVLAALKEAGPSKRP
jgi:thiol:disulfide interchange protein